METNKSSEKLVYINVCLDSIDLDTATKYKKEALVTIKKLCEKMAFHRPTGEQVAVSIDLDEFAYDKEIFSQARASRISKNQYHIEIGVGLITQLATIARGIAANKYSLRGHKKTKIIHADLRKHGREKALADFVFHYMLTFVFWHEAAHVFLGHLDWINQKNGLCMIEEFGYKPMPNNIYTHLQTLEADADRQASVWTSAMIDQITNSNPFLRYSSRIDLFYDIGYIYGSLFGFLDSVDKDVPEESRKHPKPDIRLGVVLAFVDDYLKKYYPDSAKILHQQVMSGGIDGLMQIYHSNKKGINPFAMFYFMHENGMRLDEMGVRKLQLQISSSSASSFIIQGID